MPTSFITAFRLPLYVKIYILLSLNKEFRISDPIQIALILLDLQLNIEILQVTHVMD